MAVRVGLLGPLRVIDDGGAELSLRGTKQRALIGILALHRGAPVAADQLIELVWGDDLPVNPQNALQAQIATARRALGAEAVETLGAAYALRYDVDASDVALFERLAAQGRAHADQGDHAAASARFDEALALWRGPPLADFTYEDWALAEITRLDELRAATVDARIDAELALGRHTDVIGEIEALLAQDRLREHRWAQLMLALYRSGRQADALRAANEARRTLVEEFGVDPGPELVELETQILNHEVTPAARQPTTVEPSRAPLPAPLTRFFGRRRELETVVDAVADPHVRLVTLVGPGGAGKTRLSLEVAHRIADASDADVAFVSFETLTDDDALASAVAAAIGVRRDSPAAAPVADALRVVASVLLGRPTVIVFDNCEHVVLSAARMAETLLVACPQLTILASSREALGIAGERIVPLGPLDPDAAASLFVDRAAAVRADAVLAVDAPEVATICERLDGLPLAVELAAARARALPISQIAERLADRFRLLTGGSRTAVARQQTLRAVVDWSYDLLFEDERRLFARLAVFAGGWTLAAAESICSDDASAGDEVLDLLTNLVDKSLVVAEPQADPVRYRMLQTLTEYARERLAEHGDRGEVRSRHADWFRDVGRRANGGLTSPDAGRWRTTLEADVDNLRVAFDWLCETGRARDALGLSTDVALLWWLRGDWAEGQRWADQASAAAGDGDDDLRALNDAWAAFYAANNGEHPTEAAARCRRAVDRLEESADPRQRTTGRVVLAALLSRQRDPSLHEAAERAIEAAAAHGDNWFHGVAHALMALHQIRAGALPEATEAATRSVELLETIGDRAVIFEARSVLVTVAQLAGRLDEAEALVEDMSNAACESHVRHYEEWCCTRLGFIRTAQGRLESGEELHRSALAIGADPWADAHAHLGLAVCARRCGDLPGARDHYRRALSIHEQVGARIEQAYMHLVQAWAEIESGDLDEARRLADLAEGVVPAPGAPSVTGMAMEIRAAVAAASSDRTRASELLDEAALVAPVVGHAAWWLTREDVAAVRERIGSPTS